MDLAKDVAKVIKFTMWSLNAFLTGNQDLALADVIPEWR